MSEYTIKLESRPFKNNGSAIHTAKSMDLKEFPGCEVYDWEDQYIWIARTLDTGNPVGFGSLKYLPREKWAFLSRAYVKTTYRRNGLHSKLINSRIAYAKRMQWKGVITYTTRNNHNSTNSLIKKGFLLYSPQYEYAGSDVIYLHKEFKK